jgi:hypothetical protein
MVDHSYQLYNGRSKGCFDDSTRRAHHIGVVQTQYILYRCVDEKIEERKRNERTQELQLLGSKNNRCPTHSGSMDRIIELTRILI